MTRREPPRDPGAGQGGPGLALERHQGGPGGYLEVRRETAEFTARLVGDEGVALELLSRVQRALWACALHVNPDYGVAREAFQAGLAAFQRGPDGGGA